MARKAVVRARKPGTMLPEVKDENFCQFIAAGYPITAAYEAAGFAKDKVNGYRKAKQPAIAARIVEIRAARAAELGVTIELLTAELDATIALSWQEKQPAAAHAAIMGKAKLHGLITDKTENRNINVFAELSDDEVDFEIAAMISEFSANREKKRQMKN